MPILCVIPARLGSTRLPHKPLCLLSGEPLIHMVAARAVDLCIADTVIVASDDARVLDAVRDLPVERELTGASHRSGTERVAEIVSRPEYADAEIVVNVQGDEPFFPREAALGAVACVQSGWDLGTPAAPLTADAVEDPNQVKVAVNADGRAIGFARHLPMPETGAPGVDLLRHVGIYAYTPGALRLWVSAPPVPAEERERLEQLRPLRMNLAIGIAVLPTPAPPTVDTPEDLRSARSFMDSMSVRAAR